MVRVYEVMNKDIYSWMRCLLLVGDKGGVKVKSGKASERGAKADMVVIHHRVEEEGGEEAERGTQADMVVIHHRVEVVGVGTVEEVVVGVTLEEAVVVVQDMVGKIVEPGVAMVVRKPLEYGGGDSLGNAHAAHHLRKPFQTSYPSRK